jgi:hypothetical protein
MNGKLFLFAALAVAVLVSGCPKEKRALNGARKAVEIAAQTVDLVDAEVASLYTTASDHLFRYCETQVCYDSGMRRWNKTVVAVNSMKFSLLSVENSLDAWEAGSPNGQNNLLGAVACFAESLVNLSALLDELDVKASALDNGLDYINNLFGSSLACTVGDTP